MKGVIRGERIVITAVGVLCLVLLMWHTRANAEFETGYRAPVLANAERALERGDSARAIELMSGATSRSWRRVVQAEIHSILCRAHFQQGEYQVAEEACTKALAFGGSAGAWSDLNNRGVMKMLQGRFDDAVGDFETAIRANPRARETRRNLTLARQLRQEKTSELRSVQ